jgi:hypothetical protein
MSDATPAELANELARQAGLGAPHAVTPLAGGRNNRVFRVSLEGGSDTVLKIYHHDANDLRDRLRAEWEFLNYAAARAVANVPRPLASDPARHCALYSFASGARPAAITSDLVMQAADFIVALNSPPHDDAVLAASEAAFSLGDHLDIIGRRVARLGDLDPDAPHAAEARSFIEAKVIARWSEARRAVVAAAQMRGVALDQPVAREVISPSDFGFHNALVDDGRITFLDFEYAGRDDPAKLICDFFCQPELPAPPESYAAFTGRLATTLALSEDDLWRARVLLDAYRIKWVCIMLNEFTAAGARRRAFASDHDRAARAAHQLRAAQKYLDISTS